MGAGVGIETQCLQNYSIFFIDDPVGVLFASTHFGKSAALEYC